jgi:transmembrane sensor
MRDLDFKKLIEKYQRGQLSGKEKAMLDDWFEALASGKDPTGWTEEDQLKLKHQVLESLFGDTQPSCSVHHSRRPGREKNLWSGILRVAASVLLLVTVSFAIWQFAAQADKNKVATIRTSTANSINKIVLTDGSVVWLKKNSTLEYPRRFTGSERSIILKGEALFQVANDSLHPFVIQCGDLITTVLGTSFNIKASEVDIEVVVLTGKVSLTSKNDRKGVIVMPNEKAMYLVGQKQIAKVEKQVKKTETNAAVAGTEYTMKFEDTSMEEVIRKIEGKFNVRIHTRDPKLRNCMITADFSGQSLDQTLNMIGQALGFEYEMNDDKVTLLGAGCN